MRGLWSHRGTVLGKIAHNHFSFYKGVLLGFDSLEMYERYIEHPGAVKVDPRVLKSIQKWILAELIRVAGRYGSVTPTRPKRSPRKNSKVSANGQLQPVAKTS